MLFLLKQREDSWQIHLQRISPFLVTGVDVWWSYTSNGFLFHDGDADPANPRDAFSLLHHRYHSIEDVEHRRDACWKRIVDEKIVIPAHSIKLYDPDGNKTGRVLYSDNTVTLECTSTYPLDTSTAKAEAFHNAEAPSPPTETPVCAVDTSTAEAEALHNAETPSENAVCAVDRDNEDSETSTANTAPLHNVMAERINLNLEEHQEGLKTSAGNSIKRLLGCDDGQV